MPELILTCAQCRRQLRVPEEMQGRLVKCPACEFTFTVSSEAGSTPSQTESHSVQREIAQGISQPPTSAEFRPRPAVDHDDMDVRAPVRAALIGPNICLLVTSLLTFAVTALMGVQIFLAPDEWAQQVKQQAALQRQFNPQLTLEQAQQLAELANLIIKIMAITGVILSPIVCLAAILALNRRGYWFAVIGSGLAMVNIGCFSCILGLPFGIWSLVVLLRPETKALFYQ